jgi:chemotaxis methyl-accepting protein methylase
MQRPAQEKIIKNLLSSLNSDGYLLLGASEVVFGTMQENLERKGPSVYKHTH